MVLYTWELLNKYLLEKRDEQFQESAVQIVYTSVENPLFY
jgi:hypothetical protein